MDLSTPGFQPGRESSSLSTGTIIIFPTPKKVVNMSHRTRSVPIKIVEIDENIMPIVLWLNSDSFEDL